MTGTLDTAPTSSEKCSSEIDQILNTNGILLQCKISISNIDVFIILAFYIDFFIYFEYICIKMTNLCVLSPINVTTLASYCYSEPDVFKHPGQKNVTKIKIKIVTHQVESDVSGEHHPFKREKHGNME